MKIKLFMGGEGKTFKELEEEINSWLNAHGGRIEVRQMDVATSALPPRVLTLVSVLYEEIQ